jgi:hypothetical protein
MERVIENIKFHLDDLWNQKFSEHCHPSGPGWVSATLVAHNEIVDAGWLMDGHGSDSELT